MKSRFDEGKDFIEDWRSVTVELDDSIDDIAPGLILSSITTVALEPVLLLSDLSDMHPSRKDTLRNSTEMTARYEKDDEIEHALTMIHKDEHKDDGFFNENVTFEFAKCSGCGGPKIGHSKRNEKNCIYEEFLKGKYWSVEEVKDMEDKIRKMKGFRDAVMTLDRRACHTECEINDCKDRKQKSAYDLKRHMERQHNCSEEIIKARFMYKTVDDGKFDENDSDDETFEKSSDQMIKQVLSNTANLTANQQILKQNLATQELTKAMASLMNSEKEK